MMILESGLLFGATLYNRPAYNPDQSVYRWV